MSSPPVRFASLAEAMAEMEKRIKTPAGQWRKETGRLAVPVPRSLQLNADLLTVMRIGDHHNEFTPRDRDELSRQRL